jgi:broad specificity phosphatase PhoE
MECGFSLRLILIRHGETYANVKRINPNVVTNKKGTLTKKGILQAKKTGRHLAKENINIIYSSDLHRAKETAKEINNHIKAPLVYVKDIRERDLGVFGGLPYGSFRNFVRDNNLDLLTYEPKNGESIKNAEKRVIKFFKDCIKKHKGKTVLWISHGSILKRLLMHALKDDKEKYKGLQPANCSISIIEFDKKNNPKVSLINYVDHLKQSNKNNKKKKQKKKLIKKIKRQKDKNKL